MGERKDKKDRGISRRRLLAGSVVAAPTLALLHETVPHQGLHNALSSNGDAEAATVSHGMHFTDAGHATGGHAAFSAGREVDHATNGFNPTDILRDFDYGTTRRLASGRVLREWEIVAVDKEIEVAPGVFYEAWTYNGRVPGPTLRCREGELLRIKFANGSEHPHTMHFHGIHPAFMDGMPGIGEARRGRSTPARPSPTSSTRAPSASISTTATSRRLPRTSRGGSTAPSSSTRRTAAPTPTSW